MILGLVTVTGPPSLICFLKRGMTEFGAPHHRFAVPRPQGGGLGLAVHHLDDHFAEALAGAHDVGGVHGFVRADEDEALCSVFQGCFGYFAGAQDVVLDGFVRGVLHERYVLVRGGMEDDLRLVFPEDAVYAVLISYGAY